MWGCPNKRHVRSYSLPFFAVAFYIQVAIEYLITLSRMTHLHIAKRNVNADLLIVCWKGRATSGVPVWSDAKILGPRRRFRCLPCPVISYYLKSNQSSKLEQKISNLTLSSEEPVPNLL